MNEIAVSRDFLHEDDNVLIVDDFLANGEAVKGLIDIVKQSGAYLVGVGIVIEKGFQQGGEKLRQQGVRVESLVTIQTLANGEVKFVDEC